MSTTTIGRIAGALFLLAFVVYMSGGALVDSGTGVPAVLSDVSGHQMQISAGALLMLANSACVIGIGVLVFPILRRTSELSAHAYLVTRVFEATVLAVGVLFVLTLIPLAQAQNASDTGEGTALQSVARAAQEANAYSMQIAMVGLGLGSLLFCRVLYRARLVPRPLAALGLIGYVILAAGEAVGLLGYDIGMVHYAPGGVFEVILGVLLIVKGFPVDKDQQRRTAAVSDAPPEAIDVR